MNELTEPVIVLDLGLPPRKLHPNGRVAWREKATLTKAYRGYAADTTVLAMQKLSMKRPLLTKARIQFIFYVARRQDPDNLLAWMKSGIDGMADAGLLADDRDVAYEPVVQALDPKHPRVICQVRVPGSF